MVDSSRVFVGVIFLVLSLPIYSQVIASNEDASSDDVSPEFEWVNEDHRLSDQSYHWSYPINKSDFSTVRHPVPIGKPSSISLSPSGDFVVSIHQIGCVSLIWTNWSMGMQVYCHNVNLGADITIGQVAISPDESFLAICTQPYHFTSGGMIQNWAQIHTVSVLNYSTNPKGSLGGNSWSTISGIGLIIERQGHDYSECDDIGFHNKTGNLIALFDKHETLESQGSIEFHEHDLCCSCCDFYIYTNESTGEGYRRTVNQSGFEMDQIGNVTWPKTHENSIWSDPSSGEYGAVPPGNHDSILQNNPYFLEMMLNGGIIYYNGDFGLISRSIAILDSTEAQGATPVDIEFALILLLLLTPILVMASSTVNSAVSSRLGSIPLISEDAIRSSHYSQWNVKSRDIVTGTVSTFGQGVIAVIVGSIYLSIILAGYAIYISLVIAYYALIAYLMIAGIFLLAVGYTAGLICFLPLVILGALFG